MHTLSITRVASGARPIVVGFDAGQDPRLAPAMHIVSAAADGDHFSVEVDGRRLGSARWSPGAVKSLLLGCREHGWSFTAFAGACTSETVTATPASFSASLLGAWDSDRDFAEELLSAAASPWAAVGGVDDEAVAEICSAFHCARVDGRTWVFDLDWALAAD